MMRRSEPVCPVCGSITVDAICYECGIDTSQLYWEVGLLVTGHESPSSSGNTNREPEE
jgi:hypothetical protein